MTGEQLGFGFDEMLEEQRIAHLPATIEEAIPVYRKMIDRHHDAMLAGDEKAVMAIREEAKDLAVMLNRGELLGIDGGEGSPVDLLEKATDAPVGTIPKWGQRGDFQVNMNGTPTRVTMDGMLGIGSTSMLWPGFAAHVVEKENPFPISNTGYRSFIGVHADMVPGMMPDRFAEEVIAAHVARENKPRKGRGR